MKDEDLKYYNYIMLHFSYTLSFISIFVFLLSLIWIFIMNGKINKQVTYRLSIIIIITDLIYSTFQTLAMYSRNNATCLASTWGVVFSTLISLLYTNTIALNLQLVFIHKIQVTKYLRYAYYIIPFLLALLLSLLPVFVGQVGLHYDENGSLASCWYKEGKPEGQAWAWGTFYGWIIFTILYCFLNVITTFCTLFAKRNRFKQEFRTSMVEEGTKITSVFKLLLYPAVPVICYFAIMIKLFTKSQAPELTIVSTFFQGLQGFFNCAIFFSGTLFHSDLDTARVKSIRSLTNRIEFNESKLGFSRIILNLLQLWDKKY